MRALALDYQRKARSRKRLGLILLVVGIIGVLGVGQEFARLQREREDLEAALARVEKKRIPAAGVLSEADRKRFTGDIKVAESIAERLTLPWVELFTALEAASSPNIALVALEPDVSKRTLRITAESRNKTDMLAYLDRLSEDPRLLHVHLLEHQVQTQTPGQPVRFSVQTSWAALKKID